LLKICECCCRPFEAQRASARFCSEACKKRFKRIGKAVLTGRPLHLDSSESFDDVARALAAARAASNDLARLANTGPRQLRPGCQRIADAIAAAIRKEEW
jgi:hypothetical protein